MLKFIRKHQKKFLAVFTAGLMIVFVADYGIRGAQRPSVNPGDKVMGSFAGTDVRARDVEMAGAMLDQLFRLVVVPPPSAQENRPQYMPLLSAVQISEPVQVAWLRNPVAFYLLLEEARQMPVYVDPRDLDSIAANLALVQGDRVVMLDDLPPSLARQVRTSVSALITVVTGFNRMVDMVKVSQPYMLRTALAEAQSITALTTTINATDYLAQAPQPTDEQMAEQFRKFADVPPGGISTPSNPLAFGYRYPSRLKLQYISVPRDQVVATVKARKDEYTWERDANRYYLQNQREFANPIEPATVPTTAPATAPTTGPAAVAATQPAIKPFEEVRAQILEKLMAPEVNKLTGEIRRKINDTLLADYQAWGQARPTTQFAIAQDIDPGPASSLGVPYGSYEYLEKLASTIQKQYGVLPSAASIAEFKSQEQIRQIPGIGEIATEAFDPSAPIWKSPTTAPARASGPDPQTPEHHLQLLQPSQPKADDAGNLFIYRVAQASPAHAPGDISEVADRIREDCKLARAWEQARSDARGIADRAQSDDLRKVAGERKVSTVGPFPRSTRWAIPGLELSSVEGRFRFIEEAFKLAADVSEQRQHPARVIELPSERKVLVAQLASLENRLTPQLVELLPLEWPSVIRSQWGRTTQDYWFSPDGVTQRLGYVDRETAERQAAQREAEQQAAGAPQDPGASATP